jgi:HEAT repeat protein
MEKSGSFHFAQVSGRKKTGELMRLWWMDRPSRICQSQRPLQRPRRNEASFGADELGWIMKYAKNLVRVKAAISVAFACSLWLVSAAPPKEEQLIKDLKAPLLSTVVSALNQLETFYPNSSNSLPAIKKLVTDKRPKVRRKAARVLGAMHAELDAVSLKDVCNLLKASDANEVQDGLQALRGLNVPQLVPEIIPYLKHPNEWVVRDACRTLAVLGNKDTIPLIEPLLNHADPAVKKDAQDALYKLRAKP